MLDVQESITPVPFDPSTIDLRTDAELDALPFGVIALDEPTSSLDISAQAQILNLLLRLRAERDLALVLISHDLAVIRHMTDTALVMRNGSVVEEGASELIFTSPSHDYTRELVASTPTLGRKVA